MKYTVVAERAENGISWGAYVPDLPGCIAVGPSSECVLAGPNGSGKSSCTRQVRDGSQTIDHTIPPVINPDVIAPRMNPSGPDAATMHAYRVDDIGRKGTVHLTENQMLKITDAHYLPQYPAYRTLTLRRLLSMTGGLESYDNTSSWKKSVAAKPMADVFADASIRLVYPKIKFPPGTKYFYSNTGFLLAQTVVDSLTQSKSCTKETARTIDEEKRGERERLAVQH